MSHQPLAFTLVKTVVTAQDEGRSLHPTIHTAWDLLRELIGDSISRLEQTVAWGPDHQEELRQMIDAVRDCFEADPTLETEIQTLIDESERITNLTEFPSAAPSVDAHDQAPQAPADSRSHNVIASDSTEVRRAAIPMIVLDEELDAELSETDVGSEAPPPAVEHVHLTERPYVSAEPVMFIDRSTVAADTVAQAATSNKLPFRVEPEQLPRSSAKANVTWLYVLLGLLALALLAGAGYLLFERSKEVTAVESSPDANTILPPATLAVATAPRVAELRDAGDLAGARQAQADYIDALQNSNAPAELRSEAFAELAALASLAESPLDAVTTQLRSLELAREASGDDSAAAATAHLKLAEYYLNNGETQMADSHFRQGRRTLTQPGATPNAEQQSQLDKLQTILAGQ